MKHIHYKTAVLFILLGTLGYSQVQIGITRNVDIYKPFTEEAQEYMKANDRVTSKTWSAYIQYCIFKGPKLNWSAGVSYQNIHHTVDDKVLRYTYIATPNQGSDTFYFYDPTDLISTSKSIGLRNEISYQVHRKNKFTGRLGLSNEIYLLEFFKAVYEPFNEGTNKYGIHINSSVEDTPRNFFFSSTNLSLFYCETWRLSPGFSLGGKVTLGSNVYSNWDQFKKYIWLGAGLEIGFGKGNFKE